MRLLAASKFLGKAPFQTTMGLELPDVTDVGKLWWTKSPPAFAVSLALRQTLSDKFFTWSSLIYFLSDHKLNHPYPS